MQLAAEYVAHVGTDAVLRVNVGGGDFPFVCPDPKLRLKSLPKYALELSKTKPQSAGMYQARYRARPAATDPSLYILQDEQRLTTNVLRLAGVHLPPVVYLTLTPSQAKAPDDLGSKPFGSEGACLPDCDPLEICSNYLLGCSPKRP